MVEQSKKEFVLLSGLPRTGSSLLVALLMQNPRIYGEGASALCQLMWDVQHTCDSTTALAANRRTHTKHDILSALPGLYYKDVTQPVVIEKGRTWTHPLNFSMWLNHVNSDQKAIVTVRPMEDIVKSMVMLRLKNGWKGNPYAGLFDPGSEPICRAVEAIERGKTLFAGRFLFVDYRDLVSDPLEILEQIYEFYGWPPFAHRLDQIELKTQEDDTVHGLLGMHDVRSTISVRNVNVELPDEIKALCAELDAMVYGSNLLTDNLAKQPMVITES